MGAGGAAPPVKGEDVMILIGSSIILIMFIIQAWVVPTTIMGESDFVVKYDLSEGDTFYLEVNEGEVRPTITLPSGESEVITNVNSNWEYTAEESGVYSFKFLGIESESVIEYSVSRGLIFDFVLYPIGAAILAFGIWKKVAASKEEPIEALLED
tara:strand:+ start:1049 stop:1513 length:465 start_codon:yes stop_codon:yes gene_type:complete